MDNFEHVCISLDRYERLIADADRRHAEALRLRKENNDLKEIIRKIGVPDDLKIVPNSINVNRSKVNHATGFTRVVIGFDVEE